MRGDQEPEMNRPGTRARRLGRVAFIATLATWGAYAGPASAECVPNPASAGDAVSCTGTNPAGYSVPEGVNGVTVVVEEGASVSSLGDGIVVRDDSSVTNRGQIDVNGPSSAGVAGGNGAPGQAAQFENAIEGTVTVNSPGAFGFRVGSQTRTTNAGHIEVLGDESIGIETQNTSGVVHSGTLSVAGSEAAGIVGRNGVAVEGSGAIDVSGTGATGIAVGRGSQIIYEGNLTLSGVDAQGLLGDTNARVENALDGAITIEAGASGAAGLVGGNASERVVNAGSIVSSAPASVGIDVGNDSALGLNTGTMTFSAEDSVGLRGGERALIVNELGASLQMDGQANIGLEAAGGGENINAGSLLLTGADARGLVGADGSAQVPTLFANESEGEINAQGARAVGIDFGAFAQGDNAGHLTVQGEDSIGIRAGTDSIVRNSGVVGVAGAGSIGISVGAHSDALQSSFINVAESASEAGGSLVSNDPAAGALVLMGESAPGAESRVENQRGASILADLTDLADPARAIAIQGSGGDDAVVNAGLIRGKVLLGDGDDRYVAEPGGQIVDLGQASLDGGTGSDTIELTASAAEVGTFDASGIQNFESIRVTSGQWQLTAPATASTPVVVARDGILRVAQPTTINGSYAHAPPPLVPQPGDPEPTLRTLLSAETASTEGNPAAPPLLQTTGVATLSDGVLDVVVGGGFRGQAEFTLLRADGGLVDEFNRVLLNPDPDLSVGEPVYSADEVRISVSVTGYSDNQWAMSQAITGLSGSGVDPELQGLIDQVETLEFRSYLNAMNELSPEAYDAQAQATFELGNRFVQLMLERPRFCLARPGEDNRDPHTGIPCRAHEFEPWLTTYGQFSHRNGGADHVSYDDNAGGLVLGFDRRFGENWLITATVGTAYDSVQVEGVGPGNFETLDLGLYAGFNRGPVRLEGVVSYGHSWQERSRNVAIGDFVGRTTGRYDIDRIGVRAEVEYGIERGALRIAPLLSLDYTTLLQSEVRESGGGAAALTLPSRDDTARTLRVGVDLTTTLHKTDYWTQLLENADGVWRPVLAVRWRQPLGDLSRSVSARFSAAPSELFSVEGDDRGEGFELGAGIDWTPLVADRLTFSLRYDGFVWEDIGTHAITGRIRLTF